MQRLARKKGNMSFSGLLDLVLKCEALTLTSLSLLFFHVSTWCERVRSRKIVKNSTVPKTSEKFLKICFICRSRFVNELNKRNSESFASWKFNINPWVGTNTEPYFQRQNVCAIRFLCLTWLMFNIAKVDKNLQETRIFTPDRFVFQDQFRTGSFLVARIYKSCNWHEY